MMLFKVSPSTHHTFMGPGLSHFPEADLNHLVIPYILTVSILNIFLPTFSFPSLTLTLHSEVSCKKSGIRKPFHLIPSQNYFSLNGSLRIVKDNIMV